jgi:methylenetetrahydrofolate reductase (NADPH)
MEHEQTVLGQRIASGKPLLLAEISPPQGSDAAAVRQVARKCAGKVHAVGVSDNRDHVSMSALAAASLVAAEGVEPILHVVTRDRNRIALVSDALGAQALGIRNLLCTSGTHQTLGSFHDAKSVYDIDSVQLLQTYSNLSSDAALVGENSIAGAGPFCLGGVASPDADPLELQIVRLTKKAGNGAQFLITQPVFDVDRFDRWWKEVTRRGLQKRVAVVAGIRPLLSAKEAEELSTKRPSPQIPEATLKRLGSNNDAATARAAGIAVAVETIQRLAKCEGLRGFQVCIDGDVDAALEVIDKASLGTN